MGAEVAGPRIWSVGGGKGGTGKTVISTLIGVSLARSGHQVVLVDLDLGCANAHSMLGMKTPERTLQDFLDRTVPTLDELALETTVRNLRLISGAGEQLSLANPKYAQKGRIITALRRVQADYVILDLGAGTHYNTLDFAQAASTTIAVISPQITAIENGYGYIKGLLFRQLDRYVKEDDPLAPFLAPVLRPEPGIAPDHLSACLARARASSVEGLPALEALLRRFRPNILVNQITCGRDAMAGKVVGQVVRQYLGAMPQICGYVPSDPELRRAVDCMTGLGKLSDGSVALRALRDAMGRLQEVHPQTAEEAGELAA